MWGLVGSLVGIGVSLLAARWLMRVARLQDDLHAARRVLEQIRAAGRELGRVLWRYYGPVTGDNLRAWQVLRDRFEHGGYGAEGT